MVCENLRRGSEGAQVKDAVDAESGMCTTLLFISRFNAEELTQRLR